QHHVDHVSRHSFPTRRSSDLKSIIDVVQKQVSLQNKTVVHHVLNMAKEDTVHSRIRLPVRGCLVKELSIHRWSNATVYNLLFSLDRTSTRLNSSHVSTSYAVS